MKITELDKREYLYSVIRIIMLSAILLLFASCSDGGADTADIGDESITEAEQIYESEENNVNIKAWLSNGFDKIRRESFAPDNPELSRNIYMAKNETESVQLSLLSDERVNGMKLECGEIDGGLEAEILREYTIETKKGKYYPDPVAPVKDSFTLVSGDVQTFLIRVKSTAETKAGDYTLTLNLKKGEEINASFTVKIKVWDFALPEKSGCATAVGLYKDSIAKLHNVTDAAELDALYIAYYDKLLEYRVCAYDLPYDILDERCDAYMSDPRVTAFKIPYSDDDAKITAYYEKLSGNPEWLEKAYFYPLDEPTSIEHLDSLKAISDRLARLYPNARLCTPFFRNIDYDKNTDQIAFMTGKTTLWCPKTYMYITSNVYSEAQIKKYPSFGERMAERAADGDDVWWYVCWEPGDPYCNLFVDQKGIQHRLLFWQQKQHNVSGFLYWGANYWNGTDDPWTDIATVKGLSPDVFGDGSLLYNGNRVGIKGACGSMRLEAIRDGIEDYDMLSMAQELFGADWLNAKIAAVTPSLTQYSTDSDKFEAARIEIGEAIEKEIGK